MVQKKGLHTEGMIIMKGTKLAFRTKPGGQTIPLGTTTNLTKDLFNGIPVNSYPTIRVLCDNRKSSNTTVTFLFTINQKGEFLVHLDTVALPPGGSFTKSYDVPGIGLTIQAMAAAGSGSDTVDVFVYGFSPFAHEENDCDYYNDEGDCSCDGVDEVEEE